MVERQRQEREIYRRAHKRSKDCKGVPESETIQKLQKTVAETALSPVERAEVEQRDRERLTALDREYLPFLEESVKKSDQPRLRSLEAQKTCDGGTS